jgi:hypothetical protein
MTTPSRRSLQIFLDETRAEMYVDLNEWRVADALEAVDLACLDDEAVSRAAFELHAVHVPEAASFPDELDFVVRMTMWPGTFAGLRVEEKDGDVDVTVFGADELMRTANEGEVLLSDVIHAAKAPVEGSRGERRDRVALSAAR